VPVVEDIGPSGSSENGELMRTSPSARESLRRQVLRLLDSLRPPRLGLMMMVHIDCSREVHLVTLFLVNALASAQIAAAPAVPDVSKLLAAFQN